MRGAPVCIHSNVRICSFSLKHHGPSRKIPDFVVDPPHLLGDTPRLSVLATLDQGSSECHVNFTGTPDFAETPRFLVDTPHLDRDFRAVRVDTTRFLADTPRLDRAYTNRRR